MSALPPLPSRAFGTITPSANLVVERVTQAVLTSFPAVSAHYSRTTVRGSRDSYADGYDLEGMGGAARLLADADLDGLVWNGSKGASIGFGHDRAFADAIKAETGMACTSSMLFMDDLMKRKGISRVAVVSPYTAPYQDKMLKTLRGEGYEIVAEAHSGIADNLAYMRVPLPDIAGMIRQVSGARPQAVLTLCTNFLAAWVVDAMERETGLPVYDSTLAGVAAGLALCGQDLRQGAPWGRMFAEGGIA